VFGIEAALKMLAEGAEVEDVETAVEVIVAEKD